MGVYKLESPKAIQFYDKNPKIDFNKVNEIFIDLIQNINNSIQEPPMQVNELRTLLNSLHKKVETVSSNMTVQQDLLKLTYNQISKERDYYLEQMKTIITSKENSSEILNLIRETNTTLIDKTIYSILQQIPKMNEGLSREMNLSLKIQQEQMVKETEETFKKMIQTNDTQNIDKIIQDNYCMITDKLNQTFHTFFSNESTFYQNNVNLQQFLERQKNSTLKGKISEEKLETCLVQGFPNANIINKSGESKACDYLLERKDKPNILFENKDYNTNVPNEEIKKFIRDIEHQNTHGILISQKSGINHKQDYEIDIHANNIIVFLHFVNYDETKLRTAVNLIDCLDEKIKKNMLMNQEIQISMEELSEVNKEYLNFIGQKKQLIEHYKKSYKDHLKQLEEFEMNQLTSLLNKHFTNVEQLSYPCTICNAYNAKNKRALITHQNKCKKMVVLDN